MTKELQTATAKPSAPQTISQMLEDPKTKKALSDAMAGTGVTPDRYVRILFTALRTNNTLAQCEPRSLLGAMIVSASLGLEPNTPLGHAYLIPFNNNRKQPDGTWKKVMEVNFIVGYKGYKALFRRSGLGKSIHADVVYAGDDFDFEYGSKQFLRHKPRCESREGREPLWAYCCAELRGGENVFVVEPYEDVLKKSRNSSQGYQNAVRNNKQDNPWIKNEYEMVCKSMVRRLGNSGDLPMSAEFMRAVELDAYGDHGVGGYGKFADDREEAILDLDAGQYSKIETPPADEAPPAAEHGAGYGAPPAGAVRKTATKKPAEPKPEQPAAPAPAAAPPAQQTQAPPPADENPPAPPVAGGSDETDWEFGDE
ncbi:MAG: recombinase RecT [Candidatus Binatia bacterium]